MKKIGIIAGIVIILAIVGFRLASNKKTINEHSKPTDRSSIAIPVTVAQISESIISGSFALPAVVKPQSEVNITLISSGKVKNLEFNLGSHIVKGQVIGSLENNLKLIDLETAQLLADKYRVDYDRMKDLLAGKAATEVDFGNAKYNYENANAKVAQIKQQLADANITAPLTGVITKKEVEVGEYIGTGATIAKVVDISKLKATVQVSERDIYKLTDDIPVTITTDVLPGKQFKGSVTFVSPAGDDSHNYDVEIAFDNDSRIPLKAGTFIVVKFDIKSAANVSQIPKNALVEGTKNPFVYVVKANKAVMKKITIGRELGENIEVISGLDSGDQVITSGQINLTENGIVEIINGLNK
jgi:RND family efflux transporter MFP subunit